MSVDLFRAIQRHDVRRVAELLAQGANANATNEDGWTALQIAIDETVDGGSPEVVRLLLDHGANVNAPEGQTPTLLLVWRPTNKQVARILLEAGADANVCTDSGESPLRDCVAEGDLDMVSLLLKAGADRSINDWRVADGGMTALGIAASQFNLPMIKLLVDAGADLEATDDAFKTAREYLPPRDKSDPQAWDQAMDLLSRHKP